MKSSVPFVVSIFAMASVFRGICSLVSNMDVVLVMALINACSLMFVIYFLVADIERGVEEAIEEFRIYKEKKQKCIKTLNVVLNIAILIIFTIFGVVYMFWHNEVSNDIISIIVLGISIISVELSEGIKKYTVEKIKNKLWETVDR